MRTASYLLLFLASAFHAGAVEKDVGGTITYQTSAPTSVDIAHWTTGWGAAGITGWDFVGSVGGAAGVYVGNGWVLTAAHVDPGAFTLSGTTYQVVPDSYRVLLNGDGSVADLKLFQLADEPDLPRMRIATAPPDAFAQNQSGSQVAMIGYGGGQGKTWGLNTVTQSDVTVLELTYKSTDFATAYGTTTVGQGMNTASITNDYTLVLGDSGGGDFIWNSALSVWDLAGINEAVETNKDSYMVQLSAYAPQINAIVSIPEPSASLLLGLGIAAATARRRPQSSRFVHRSRSE